MKVLIVAELNQDQLKENTLSVITAGLRLSDAVDVMVLGHACTDAAAKVSHVQGVAQVLKLEHAALEHHQADVVAQAVLAVADRYDAILMPGSTYGKNCLPFIAAKLDVQQISEVIEILEKDAFKRPIYAGNAIETVQSQDEKKLLTIRTTAFDKAADSESACAIESLDLEISASNTPFKSLEASKSDRPDLTAARVVISGGRGFQNGENFKMLEQLADKLHAAIGASRAAVDAGYVSNDYQVGQTGKIVAPELYIAIGISGAIQHLAGMKDSKVIVAINKDPEAPIFQVADYGLVGDLFEIVPSLIEKL